MGQEIFQSQAKRLYGPGKMGFNSLFGDGEMAGDLFLGISCLPAELINELAFFRQMADKGSKFVPELFEAQLLLR